MNARDMRKNMRRKNIEKKMEHKKDSTDNKQISMRRKAYRE